MVHLPSPDGFRLVFGSALFRYGLTIPVLPRLFAESSEGEWNRFLPALFLFGTRIFVRTQLAIRKRWSKYI